MNLIIWLIVGGVIGWLASVVMKTDAQQGIILNVVVGVVGALLGGWLLSPLVGAGTVNQGDFSLMGLLVSFGGAVILLLIVNFIRRGTARKA
jgi:uncharacterized membrane protein YeaQ/YmgE (transglycosylase-associated protein family)